jgi:hypothetical protein
MAAPAARTPQPTAGIPRRLKLALVELGGVAVMLAGGRMLITGDVLGLPTVAYGVDLLVRPSARRLPRVDTLANLVMRWRGRPGP